MKDANQLKVMLGILAMTGLGAFTAPAEATPVPVAPLETSTSLSNVLEQAKLNGLLTGQKSQVTGVPKASLQRFDSSTTSSMKPPDSCCNNSGCSCK